MWGKHDVKDIKRRLTRFTALESVAVNAQTSQVSVDYDSSGTSYDQIENTLNKMGYQIIDDHSRSTPDKPRNRRLTKNPLQSADFLAFLPFLPKPNLTKQKEVFLVPRGVKKSVNYDEELMKLTRKSPLTNTIKELQDKKTALLNQKEQKELRAERGGGVLRYDLFTT